MREDSVKIMKNLFSCNTCVRENDISFEECYGLVRQLQNKDFSFTTYTGTSDTRQLWLQLRDKIPVCYHGKEDCGERYTENCPGCKKHADGRRQIQARINMLYQKGFDFKNQKGDPADETWYKEMRQRCKDINNEPKNENTQL